MLGARAAPAGDGTAHSRLPHAVPAYFTAEAALALGDPDAALADLAIAVETDEAMGALPWLA